MSARPEHVVVTGGSGRLGRWVVNEVAATADVTVVDLAAPENLPVRFVEADVRDIDAVRVAMSGCDAIIHLAALDDGVAENAESYIDVNLRGTWNVLQTAEESGIQRVVLASSVAALGLGPENPPARLPIGIDAELDPRQAYGISKKVCEEFARSFVRRGTLDVICLRPCLIAQDDITYSIACLTAELDNGHPPPPASSPDWRILRETLAPSRAVVTPGDAARAFLAALHADIRGFAACFVTGRDNCSSIPTIDLITRNCGAAPEVKDPELYRTNPRASAYDLRPASTLLGWEPVDDWHEHLRAVIKQAEFTQQ